MVLSSITASSADDKSETSDGTYGKTTVSIVFGGGGDYRALTVTNGDSVDTSASIVNGISVSFGAGTITNFGTIGSPIYTHTVNDKSSVKTTSAIGRSTMAGPSTTRPSGTIDGVSFFKIKGVVVNSGTIDSPGTYGSSNSSRKDAVQLSGGGSLRNNAGGTINGVLLNSRRSRVNTIVNEGTINGATSADYTTGANVVSSINIQGFGSVTNGSATNAQAELTDGVISTAATIINFGIIGESSDGMAVSLAVDDSIFVEEGTGALTGDVAGGGGELILGGDARRGHAHRPRQHDHGVFEDQRLAGRDLDARERDRDGVCGRFLRRGDSDLFRHHQHRDDDRRRWARRLSIRRRDAADGREDQDRCVHGLRGAAPS